MPLQWPKEFFALQNQSTPLPRVLRATAFASTYAKTLRRTGPPSSLRLPPSSDFGGTSPTSLSPAPQNRRIHSAPEISLVVKSRASRLRRQVRSRCWNPELRNPELQLLEIIPVTTHPAEPRCQRLSSSRIRRRRLQRHPVGLIVSLP
jgi:hypothetical protein